MKYIALIFSIFSLYALCSSNILEKKLLFLSKNEILYKLENPIHVQIAIKTNIAAAIAHKTISDHSIENLINMACIYYTIAAKTIIFCPLDIQEAIQEIIKTAKIINYAKL
jgi:hypothetical protein